MVRIGFIFSCFLSCILIGVVGATNAPPDEFTPYSMESIPKTIQARRELRNRSLRNLSATIHGRSQRYVLNRLQLWNPGQTLKVAFLGGNSALHKDIETAALEWTKYGNIKLDFGLDPASGNYRQWTRSDTGYAADIRISFDEPDSGYSSSVGTEAIDPSIDKPNEASMSFYRFDVLKPSNWQRIVCHEFGHALGFEHEHQSPASGCDQEFKWYDDVGYVPKTDANGAYIANGGKYPGVYTVLGGYPNYWSEADVNYNLRQLKDSSAYLIGTFDPLSIMLYNFPPQMFVNGKQSPCYHELNLTLSSGDKSGVALVYPTDIASVNQILNEKKLFLRTIIESKTFSLEGEKGLKIQLEKINR